MAPADNLAYLYGENFSAISFISFSLIYFHFPPFPFFNFPTSLPINAAIPRCTPRSPVEKTSILFNPKQANISTLHLPRPRTLMSSSRTSSYVAENNISVVSSPLWNFSARPYTYSALRCDKPAGRRASIELATTCDGVGNEWRLASSISGLKRATNLFLMDFAAAPETYIGNLVYTALLTIALQ